MWKRSLPLWAPARDYKLNLFLKRKDVEEWGESGLCRGIPSVEKKPRTGLEWFKGGNRKKALGEPVSFGE